MWLHVIAVAATAATPCPERTGDPAALFEKDAGRVVSALREGDVCLAQAAVDAAVAIGPSMANPLVRVLVDETRDRPWPPPEAVALERIGAGAVEVLAAALDAPKTAWRARRVLQTIGRPSIGPLRRSLADAPAGAPMRHQAALALATLGDDDPKVVATLFDSVERPDWSLSHEAASALACLGRSAWPAWTAALRARSVPAARALKDLRQYCAACSGAVPRGAVSEGLAQAIEEGLGDPMFRETGMLALGAVGPPGLVRLRRLADSADEAIRKTAMEGLGLQGPAALKDLEKAIADHDVEVRAAAAQALSVWKMGSRSIPLLAIAMRDPEAAVRRQVVNSLGTPCMGPSCGDDYSAGVPVLGQALLDEDTMVRRSTVHQIDGFGTLAVPAVLRALDTPYPVCVEAAWTAGSIGNDELQHRRRPAQGASTQLLPALIRRVRDPLCRPAALGALGRMSQLSGPHIVELVGDSDPEVAWSAVGLIRQLGDAAAAMSPVLEGLLQRPETRERAMEALAGTATALGRDSIRITLDSLADRTERWPAADLLGRLARGDEAVVLDLRASLTDPARQEAAVVALGKAGSAARTALEDIDKLAGAPSAPVREAARFAAEAIRATQ